MNPCFCYLAVWEQVHLVDGHYHCIHQNLPNHKAFGSLRGSTDVRSRDAFPCMHACIHPSINTSARRQDGQRSSKIESVCTR
jgi:hypothetical protein